MSWFNGKTEEGNVTTAEAPQDVKQASATIIEKHKRKRGRPKKTRDVDDGQEMGSENSGENNSPTFGASHEMNRNLFNMAANCIEQIGIKIAQGASRQLCPNDEKFEKEMVKSATWDEKTKVIWVESGTSVADKYSWALNYAAEISFAGATLTIGAAYWVMWNGFKKIAADLLKIKQNESRASSNEIAHNG